MEWLRKIFLPINNSKNDEEKQHAQRRIAIYGWHIIQPGDFHVHNYYLWRKLSGDKFSGWGNTDLRSDFYREKNKQKETSLHLFLPRTNSRNRTGNRILHPEPHNTV
jgi:hypothetical protein